MEMGLEAHMYASQWFLTLFTAKFPLFMVFHILDLVLSEVGNSGVWWLDRCMGGVRLGMGDDM